MKFETEIPKQTWVTLPKPCHPETEKSNMATRQPFRKWRHWKINRLLPIYISILPLKFGVDIQSQTKVSPETKKSNVATRRPFWKWHCWKSMGSYPYIQVLCHLSLELIFKAKLKLESGIQKIQYGHQAAILKVTSLKINRLLPMATINTHMKFEIEIPKETWLMLRKPCRLQTDGWTDGRTDKVNPVYPPPTSLGRGMKRLWINLHVDLKRLN